jgi:hypothetical protein
VIFESKADFLTLASWDPGGRKCEFHIREKLSVTLTVSFSFPAPAPVEEKLYSCKSSQSTVSQRQLLLGKGSIPHTRYL